MTLVAGCGNKAPVDLVEVAPGGAVSQSRNRHGAVPVATEFRHAMTISNPTVDRAAISSFKLSCECATLQPANLIVEPGEQEICHLLVDLRKESTFVGELGIEINGMNEQGGVVLRHLVIVDVEP